jgi:hypothetical protein
LEEDPLGAVSILDPGAVDHDGQEQTEGVYQDMALPTVDLLMFVAADGAGGPPFW